MTAILASDVFPSLEQANPLDSIVEDDVPARFGSNWFEHDREEREQQLRKADGEGELRFGQMIIQQDDHQVEELDSLIDAQKRLLFTETKMKANNDSAEALFE